MSTCSVSARPTVIGAGSMAGRLAWCCRRIYLKAILIHKQDRVESGGPGEQGHWRRKGETRLLKPYSPRPLTRFLHRATPPNPFKQFYFLSLCCIVLISKALHRMKAWLGWKCLPKPGVVTCNPSTWETKTKARGRSRPACSV